MKEDAGGLNQRLLWWIGLEPWGDRDINLCVIYLCYQKRKQRALHRQILIIIIWLSLYFFLVCRNIL